MPDKIGFISLGCPKNTVDSEIMLNHLKNDGWEFTEKLEEADCIVINTCAFIAPAREEAVNTILDAAENKKTGRCRRLVVAGCLVNRYREELIKEIPEIDGFVDTFSLNGITNAVKPGSAQRTVSSIEKYPTKNSAQWSSDRLLITPPHYAYLKIADGCSHRCSFCAIPLIKGPQCSRDVEDIFSEAELLASRGVKELIIISQDTTGWGKDLDSPKKLTSMLQRLDSSKLFRWIRLMYMYPSEIDDSILDTIAQSSSILPYFDIPLQHIDSQILQNMKRGGNGDSFISLIVGIRNRIPEAVIRTSLVVGFPGENEETIKKLEQFLLDTKIDNVGIFIYSEEEGTAAFDEFKDEIQERTKNSWRKKLMKIQSRISAENLSRYKGRMIDVIIDGEHPESEYLLTGRFFGQAPEIDGTVIITEGNADQGDIVKVEITETWDYDIAGRIVNLND